MQVAHGVTMDGSPVHVDRGMLEPLLSAARHDPDVAVRLAAFDAASRLPLTEDAWTAYWSALRGEIAGSVQDPEARTEALRLAVRIPLRSVRRDLRRVAANADDPAATGLCDALAAAGDRLQIARLLQAADSGQCEALERLAAMPLEAEGIPAARIPAPPADAGSGTRLWFALAIARLGEYSALDAFLRGLEQEPDMFMGSQGVPYERIAAIRPVPRTLDEHLRAALPTVDGVERHAAARMARIIIWAATGMADAAGQPMEPTPPAPGADATVARAAGDDERALVPESEVAGLLIRAVEEANAKALQLPAPAPASQILGNPLIGLVGALPRSTDWPVAAIVIAQLEAERPALDDEQLGWVVARGPASGAIRELAALIASASPVPERLRILRICASAADVLSRRGGSPYRGADSGGSGAPVVRSPLIDDERLVLLAATDDAREVEERRVNACILHAGLRRNTFRADADNVIRCWIGLPDLDAAVADQPVPDVYIPREGLSLTVQLYWQDGSGRDHTDSQPMLLPAARTARSGDCDLHLHVPEGERYVKADIMFLYRGRAFEFVRLEAGVLEEGEVERPRDRMQLRVQTSRREVIEQADSRPVDASFVYGDNRSSAAQHSAAPAPPGLRVFGRSGIAGFDLSDAEDAIKWLNEVLFATEKMVARRQEARRDANVFGSAGPRPEPALDADDPDVRSLLRDMARHGAGLYNQLVAQGFSDPGPRIQVLNEDPTHYVPLEFVYDRGYPVGDAEVCRSGLKALASGEVACPACTVPVLGGERSSAPIICPTGFWSMRKVIERVGTGAAGKGSTPVAARRSLPVLDSVAFASSHLVPEEERASTQEALRRSFGRLSVAEDWTQWLQAVATHPSLLVLLPHHGIQGRLDYLEIGDQKLPERLGKLSRAQLVREYVNADGRDPGPVVLLLGCQTAAETETGYVRMTQLVYQQRASVVLGTLAEILGRDAAPLVRELVAELAGVMDGKADFGTVMLRVRRRMLARGNLIALCLVAVGDAQWHLAPRPDAAGP